METKDTNKDYIPFGKEWEKDILDMRKLDIIGLYRRVCIENINLKNQSGEKQLFEELGKLVYEQRSILINWAKIAGTALPKTIRTICRQIFEFNSEKKG